MHFRKLILFIPRLIKRFSLFVLNYIYDAFFFMTQSGVFSNNSKGKVLGKIIYYYHSIEKGLINDSLRYRYGKEKIHILVCNLKIWLKRDYSILNSQFIAACSTLDKYYSIHKNLNIDICDIISDEDIQIIRKYSRTEIGGFKECSNEEYFQYASSSFDVFSNSRHSIRHFNGQLVPKNILDDVVKLSLNAPSVCNRQSVHVTLVNDLSLVKGVLQVQRGMNASSKTVNQVLIITSDMGSFVSEVERNQMFVDGGIFLQNILYALHFHKIGACALNWSKPFFFDFKLKKLLGIKSSHKIIAVIAIGYPRQIIKMPWSERKQIQEIFNILD